MKRLALLISLSIFGFVTTMVFQNCGGFKLEEGQFSSGIPVYIKTATPGTPYNQLTGFPSLDYSARKGTLQTDVNNCLIGLDACIFWKSPYATSWIRQSILRDPPPGDAPSDVELQNNQVFSVGLAPYVTANSLRNAHFDVFYTDEGGLPQRLPLVNNKWQKSFSEGHSRQTPVNQRFAIEQVQTYLYLNAFRDALLGDGGNFYASNGTIGVDVVNVASGYNVNFDPITNTIYAGLRFGQEGRYYTLSQSSELIIREAARANLYYGNSTIKNAKPSAVYAIPCNPSAGRPYYVTDGNNLIIREGEVLNRLRSYCGHANVISVTIHNYCATDAGCWKAIELGQADFLTYVMFSTLPSIGETALPFADVRYWKKRSNIRRNNVAANFGVSFYDNFTQRDIAYAGEVKGMAELFADILFDIYADSGVDKPMFLKTVIKFLTQISTATTFVDAKSLMLAIDTAEHASRNGTRIRAMFEQRGY